MPDEVIVVIGGFLFILLFLTGGVMLKAPAGQKRLYFFGGLVVSVGIGLIMIHIFLEYWVLTRLSLLSLHSLHVLLQICAPTGVIVYFVDKALTNRMRNIPRLEGMRVILSFCLLGYVGMVLLLIPLEPIIVLPALFSSLQAPTTSCLPRWFYLRVVCRGPWLFTGYWAHGAQVLLAGPWYAWQVEYCCSFSSFRFFCSCSEPWG